MTDAQKKLVLGAQGSIWGERITELCGFAQPGKFSKFFKRQTGTTPRDYRKGGGK